MKKSTIAAAVGLALGGAALSAQAQLTSSATLAYTSGNAGNWNDAGSAGASYFTMVVDSVGTVLYTGLEVGTDGGVHIGAPAQTLGSAFSHGGLPYDIIYPTAGYTSDHGPIDLGWGFFGNTGLHFSSSAIVVVSDGGFTKTLDFSGWNVSWNGIPAINMGGGIQVVPSTNTKPDKTYNNGTGLATITCSLASCSNSSSFTLDYAAVVPQNDPSNFGGTPYTFHLEGHISSVPVPAAAWLLGSGLVGLVGVARRRKASV